MVGIVRQVPIRDWKEAGSNKRLKREEYYHDLKVNYLNKLLLDSLNLTVFLNVFTDK